MTTKTESEVARNFYEQVYGRGHPINYGGDEAGFEQRNAPLRASLGKWMVALKIPDDAMVVEVGCGMGYLDACHPNWHGIEYSSTAVERARTELGKVNIEQGDARALPMKAASVDFIFSFAALEHIPEVERAFQEIARVLKPGGAALIGPAWNCRAWTVKKLEIRPYAELGLLDKVEKWLIPLRNNILFRALMSMPGRIAREFRYTLKINMPLQYKRLSPDFSLNQRYPHISDDDAFVSMDAHAGLMYFLAAGWSSPSHQGRIRRLLIRGAEIVVVKPDH
jgi:SAM-dependent methyltransferase